MGSEQAPYWTSDGVTLHLGDCIQVMAGMPDNSVDAIVTDPPYGLEFMGRDWDSFKDAAPDMRQPGDEDYAAGPGPYGRMTVRHGTANSYFGSGYTEKPRWGGRPESTDRRGQMNVPNFYVAGRAFQDWCSTWVPEALRVLKPGGHIVAFGGTRTFHRLACALEDGGFEIRDALADLTGIAGPGLLWMYGQGFPKSLNVSKAIDRHLGAEREVTGTKKLESYGKGEVYGGMPDKGGVQEITAPGSEESAQWEGWGTALKPSWEPIILARKPIERSVAYNIMKYGTGALNVDGCRLDGIKDVPASVRTKQGNVYGDLTKLDGTTGGFDPFTGRWPPNAVLAHSADCQVIGKRKVKGSRVGPSGPVPGLGSTYALNGARPERGIGDEDRMEEVETWACAEGCPVRELDQQSGVRPAGSMVTGAEPSDRMGSNGIYGKSSARAFWPGYGDSGGASRFFPVFRYEAKATTAERPKVWSPDCDCETIKPSSQPRGTAGSQSENDSSWSMSGSGSRRTGEQSPSGTTSTTEMATSSTMTSPTSSSSPNWSTSESTRDASFEMASGGSHAESAESSSQSPLSTGTSLPKAGRPMADAVPVISRASSRPSNCVVCGTPYKSEMHATVKPVGLMEWLVRLITPPGGVVLDPFAGSGTTGEACIINHFDVILIEKDEAYCRLIEKRLTKPIQAGLF